MGSISFRRFIGYMYTVHAASVIPVPSCVSDFPPKCTRRFAVNTKRASIATRSVIYLRSLSFIYHSFGFVLEAIVIHIANEVL